MGRGALELELKFTGSPAAIAALPQSDLMRKLGSSEGAWVRLASRYFDTADEALARDGIALRLRQENGLQVQAVKRATPAGAVVREEYERILPDRSCFPALTGQTVIDQTIKSAERGLAEIASLRVDRWIQPVAFRGSHFTIAVDLGEGRAGPSSISAPIAELEIEYVHGEMGHLFELARLFAEKFPLRLAARSKLETALAAGSGRRYGLDKLEKPLIDPEAPAIETLQTMLAAIAVRVADIQPILLDIRSPTGVHQMRVALRRFRAIERTFRRAVKTDSLYALTRRARSIAHGLGPARDLDVFIDETLPDVFERTHTPVGAAALRERAEAGRAAAWADAYAIVADKSFTRFAIDLMEAGVLAPWAAEARKRGRAPLRAFAPGALDKALRRTMRVEAVMDRATLAARHPLRIAVKKQRYAAQMLGALYPKDVRKAYMRALSGLQNALGVVNDAVVAQSLAETIALGGGDDAMRAAGFIAGFKAAEAEAAAAEIDQAWEIFENTVPFWRDIETL